MSVEFENDFKPVSRQNPSVQQFAGQNNFQSTTATGMAGWLLRKGIIKNESQAGVVLLTVVVINILITIFVIYRFLL